MKFAPQAAHEGRQSAGATSLDTATTSMPRSRKARLKVAVARTWAEGCATCTPHTGLARDFPLCHVLRPFRQVSVGYRWPAASERPPYPKSWVVRAMSWSWSSLSSIAKSAL